MLSSWPGGQPNVADPSWSKHVADVLRRNDIRLYATVPDYIVSHVLEHLWADATCTVVTATREEEALGILSGAWLGGQRGALLMQNSGLGNCINTLTSLNIASQLPVVLVISQRGDLGEFNPAQVPMGQATERILDAVGIRYVMPRSVAELESQADGLVKLGYTRSLPVAFVLPAELTGGKLG
jgi:sulfopyruvate decarboxylase alpha subunit